MHSTPRAGAYSRASRTVLTTPSRPARLGEDSDLTSTSSLPVSSMADPSDTGFFAPPAINASPSFRCGSGEEIPQTAEFDLTAKPKLFHTARAPNIDCSYSTDGQHSVTRSAGGETLFPGLEEVIVPVNFATSSFTSRSSGDEGYRYRDTLATIKPGSSSGSEMTGRSFHDQSAVHAKRMDQHQSITHEDFSVPLNDSTQRSEHSASSRGPSRSTGNGMKRSVATSDMQSSRTTSGKFRSKTPIVQRATSAGRWIPQGGSSVHGRPSTPYRQNTHTRSVPFEPVSSQSDLPGSSTDEVRQNEGSHGHLRTDEEAISDRAEELPDGSQLPTCGRLLISNQRLIGTSQVGLEDSSDIFSSVEEARGRSQMVQDGGSKRNEALAQIWNVSDWGAPFAQRPLDNFGFPSPGVDDVVEMSSLVRESVQPERFVLSSQLDGDMPHARSSSPLAFSSSNSSSGYSKTRTPTAETHCQRRRYGYTPSLVTLPDEDESGGLRGVWRGAEVLARMEGEGEGEDAQHADEEKVGIDKATKACKGKRREPALDGGIDLEGVSQPEDFVRTPSLTQSLDRRRSKLDKDD
ncbi:hypothetical protein BD324DRAFT_72987 [Kockovaella imperatae]|uniref:Uncharacterized protein n=1 Tax=Kockovaella imperatae TaxID=4999 RepID=A0A1Y1UCE1_9TREE|nr:hypothetical protein BD324DRAFT_72987 [Kockovaella imperatae]ORX35711.1 hypothetical protein BD324DRAFT_72987 [Kockovaella imperatae]